MSHTKLVFLTLSFVAIAGSFAQAQPSASRLARPPTSYRVVQTFRIGGTGGWDYLTVDPQQQAALRPPQHPHDGH